MVAFLQPEFRDPGKFTERDPPLRYSPPQHIPEAGQENDFDYIASETANYLSANAFSGRGNVFLMVAYNLTAENDFNNNNFEDLLDYVWLLVVLEVYFKNANLSNQILKNSIGLGCLLYAASYVDQHIRDYDHSDGFNDREMKELDKYLRVLDEIQPDLDDFRSKALPLGEGRSAGRSHRNSTTSLGSGLFGNERENKSGNAYKSTNDMSALRNKYRKPIKTEEREPRGERAPRREETPKTQQPKVWKFSFTQPYQALFKYSEYKSVLGLSKGQVVENVIPLTESEIMDRNKHRIINTVLNRPAVATRQSMSDILETFGTTDLGDLEPLKDFNMSVPDKPFFLEQTVCMHTRDFMNFIPRVANWDLGSKHADMVIAKATVVSSIYQETNLNNKRLYKELSKAETLKEILGLLRDHKDVASREYLLQINRRLTDTLRNFIRTSMGMHAASFGSFMVDYDSFVKFLADSNIVSTFERFEGFLIRNALGECNDEDLTVYADMVFDNDVDEALKHTNLSKTVGVVFLKYTLDELEYDVVEGKPYLVEKSYNTVLSKLLSKYLETARSTGYAGDETYILLADGNVFNVSAAFFAQGEFLLTLIPFDMLS